MAGRFEGSGSGSGGVEGLEHQDCGFRAIFLYVAECQGFEGISFGGYGFGEGRGFRV